MLVAVRKQDGAGQLTAYVIDPQSGQKRAAVNTPMQASMRDTASAVVREYRGAAGKVQ
jgi:hypothetical protein